MDFLEYRMVFFFSVPMPLATFMVIFLKLSVYFLLKPETFTLKHQIHRFRQKAYCRQYRQQTWKRISFRQNDILWKQYKLYLTKFFFFYDNGDIIVLYLLSSDAGNAGNCGCCSPRNTFWRSEMCLSLDAILCNDASTANATRATVVEHCMKNGCRKRKLNW